MWQQEAVSLLLLIALLLMWPLVLVGKVRKACVEHMSKHKSRFGVFVAEDFREYLCRIRQPGVWGDDLEIRYL